MIEKSIKIQLPNSIQNTTFDKIKRMIKGDIDSIVIKESNNPGSTTSIMVGVHGDEYSGVEALDDIIEDIEITFGKVYFIYANLKAIESNLRFTEKNMNRCFIINDKGTTYEEIRSNEIIEYLDDSDYLLDVHNTLGQNSSPTFLISEHKEYGKYFEVDFVVSGFDDLHKGGSDGYMNNSGKIGLCIECGSIYAGSRDETKKLAKDSILNFLKYSGNISGNAKEYSSKNTINFNEIYKSKSDNFRFTREFDDFENIIAGTIIAIDNGVKIIANEDSIILFAYSPEKAGDDCFCLGQKIK